MNDIILNMKKQKLVLEYIYSLYKNKKIQDGDFIPSENFLIIKLNFSRNTIRLALLKLINLGVLIPIHGKGYIFNYKNSQLLKSFSNHYGDNYSSVFIEKRVVDKYEPLLKTKPFIEIIKIRYKKNIPFIVTYQRINIRTFNKFGNDLYKKSIYSAFYSIGYKISHAKKTITYVKTPSEVKLFLPKFENNSLLLISQTVDVDGIVIEASYNFYYPKKFSWNWNENFF